MSDRRALEYRNEDEVIADVARLRRGYTQAGSWSLPQMCHHLEKSIRYRMRPGPFEPTTPEQEARRDQFHEIMARGRLPDGIAAPEQMMPPQQCGDEAIDEFIAALKEFQAFPGPIAPHRLFGHLRDADARRLNLIHCAHHLSYLTPTT